MLQVPLDSAKLADTLNWQCLVVMVFLIDKGEEQKFGDGFKGKGTTIHLFN
ncbi:hypothetical protein [Candidatus Protochlamydia amoebophila]|uniref:Uncharacterized protein n=1 Tax=Candidatus Protochlamydia amoebophila TaxID=362787 RepID=A0A0C1JXA8_9BACT|nr:hypothetical protein [Candidatus Protochlamydia amoebophila]KIC71882.1 hypothetical protein DB44_CW00550 [Candidatus Protochlamydia amoebophila]